MVTWVPPPVAPAAGSTALTTGPLPASDPSANAVALAPPLLLTVRPVNVRVVDVFAELMTVTEAVSVASL